MTEYQKIAIGLLGLTHPEIFLSARNKSNAPAQPSWSTQSQPSVARRSKPMAERARAVVRAVKFAFAALLTGSRAVPLGDNGQLIKELGAYGARLHRFTSRKTYQKT
jgi:hypothetical protein